MANLSLVFDLLARDQASPTFRKVGSEAERAGHQVEGFGGRIGGSVHHVNELADSLKFAAAGLAGAAIVEGFRTLYEKAEESEKIGRLTEQVIKSTGGAANLTAKQIEDLATAISNKTGVDDEAVQSGENLLLTFTNVRNEVGKGNDIFSQASALVTDMSVALGTDLKSSAIQVGKALNDPIKGVTALQRVGVSFTQSQRDQIKVLVDSGKTLEAQKIILGELNREFGGAAAAASTPVQKLKVQIDNLAEDLGKTLIPYINDFATFMAHDVLPAVDDVAGAIGPVLGGALHIAGGALELVLKTVQGVAKVFGDLPGPIQVGIAAAGLWVVAGGKIVSTVSGIITKFQAFRDEIVLQRALLASQSTTISDTERALGGLGTQAERTGGQFGLIRGAAGNFARAIGPALGIGAAIFAISGLIDVLQNASYASKQAADAQRDLNDALNESKGIIDENVRATAAKVAQDKGLLDVADQVGISLSDVTDAVLGNGDAYSRVKAQLDQFIAAHTQTSNTVRGTVTRIDEEGQAALDAEQLLGQLTGTVGANASSQDQLARATSQTTESTGFLSQAFQFARDAGAKLATRLQDISTAASDAQSKTELFKTALDALSGDTVDLSQAQADLYEALDAANGALTNLAGSVLDSAGALNTQTEAGRKAQDVLFNIRERGEQYIATLERTGASTETVLAADKNLRESFIRSAQQMGVSREAAEKLADQILGIPSERETEIRADTTSAVQKAHDFVNQLLGIPNRTVRVDADTSSARDTISRLIGDLNSQGFFGVLHFFQGRAAGGVLDGYSPTPTSDNILFRGTAGEFVQPVRSVSHYGIPFMEAVRTGRFPKEIAQRYVGAFAGGGYLPPVGYPDFVGRVALNDSVANQLRNSFPAYSVSAGVQQWAGLVARVLALLGQPGFLVGSVLKLIQFESGGNPYAINLTDINAQRGDPSRGLTQTIGATFNAYAGPYRSLGIYNPLANIYAGLNYGIHRYGSIANIPGIRSLAAGGGYRPYDNGGELLPGYTLAYNGTGKRETVRTAEQEAALRQPVQVRVFIGDRELTDIVRVEAEGVTTAALNAVNGRSRRNR